MMVKKRKLIVVLGVILVLVWVPLLVGCTESDKVSTNISTDADNFKVVRQITVINTRTDKVILQATGKMSVERSDKKTTIVIKTGEKEYKKHIIYENSWTASSIEQIEAHKTNPYAYNFAINPKQIMHGWTDIEFVND
jgi:type IV pilus biogenesis protein CpaD/CtpE